MKALLFSALLILALSPVAEAKRLKISSSTASSEYPPDDAGSYEASKVTDRKLSTSWVEGEEGSGLGSWIELDLGGDHDVKQIKLWGGLWYSYGYWERANRPKEVEVRFSDGSEQSFDFSDEKVVQVLDLTSPKTTSTIRIRIKQVYSGNTWLDTAVSEIQVFDDQPEDFAVVTSMDASTKSPLDADGDYEPINVADGLSDSMWCEGDKEGDGTGDWLQFTFDSTQSVSKLKMINGIGTGLPYWMKGNRAAAGTLLFSDGSTEAITIRNTMLPQTVEFPAHRTSSVKLTFTEVKRGKEFNDLCISEASFSK